MKQRDDYLWKGILEDVFEDFLRFLHPDIDSIIDFGKGITFLDKELAQLYPPDDDDFTPKIVDKLAQVYTREGHQKWILIHVEVQGVYQKNFPLRMFTYYYRIFDKYRQPVTAYAILTEPGQKARVNCYENQLLGTGTCYRFNIFKIIAQDEKKLLASNNPFAAIVLITQAAIKQSKEQLTDSDILQRKTELMRRLVAMNIPKLKIRVVLNFLTLYIRFQNPENNLIFDEHKKQLTEGGTTMGIEELILHRERTLGHREGKSEGHKEGRSEGRLELSYEMAAKMKNDGLALQKIIEYTGLSLEEIQQL